MQVFCPNLNNKHIKAEFEELKEVLGEDLAYLVWHKSEGEGLGNHPGLADSEQFKQAVESTGDRNSAIMSIAKLMLTDASKLQLQDNSISAYDIATLIDAERDNYVKGVVNTYISNNQEADENEINNIKNKSRIQFDKQKLQEITNDNIIPEDVKLVMLAAITSEDLHQAEGILTILDRINGNYDSSQHLTSKDKDVFKQIKDGTVTRLRSQLSRTVKNTRLIDELKRELDILDLRNEDNIDDVFDTILDFLMRAENEIGRTTRFIKTELSDDLSKWDPQLINYIKQDLIGYYEGLLKSVRDLFNPDSAVYKINKIRSEDPTAIDLENLVKLLYTDLINLQEDYQSTVVMPYAEKILIDFVLDSDVIDNKEQFIKNMKTWLYQDTAFGDLRAMEVVLGMASRSKSPIVRIVEKMMSDVEFERNRQVLKKGLKLIRLYNKIRPKGSQISFSNFLKTFIELDGEDGKSGMPTGYFVRDRNYGKFYKDKDAFEKKLREKYAKFGVTWKENEYNDSVEIIFPEEDHKAENSVFNRYYDELDEWLDKHCERRYKLAYYKAKRRIMSPDSIKALQFIQHQIDILCQKALDEDGWVDTNKLSVSERSKLSELKRQKKELGCPYIFRTNSDGVVTLEKKVGKDAEIADDIWKWNRFIQDHVKYKDNKEKFEKALQKYPENSVERRRFLRDNFIQKINPDIYSAIKQWYGEGIDYGEEYKQLLHKYRSIINHIKDYEGYSSQNLSKLGTGINQDSSVWQELQQIEQRMYDIRHEYAQDNTSTDARDISGIKSNEESPKYLVSYMVMSPEQDKTFYDYLMNLYISNPGYTGNALQEFNKLFTYKDSKGVYRILKAFSYLGPVAEEFKFDPTNEAEQPKKSLIHTYSSLFSELDESSDFVNEKWSKKVGTSLLPKVRQNGSERVKDSVDYTNDRYYEIIKNKDYKEFYELLLSTMDEANLMLPIRATERRYLMPQITGRGLQVLGRSRSLLDLLKSIGYTFLDVFTTKFTEKDGDVSTNWDLPRRPDGTVVNNIPIRFIKRLDDPFLISTDVIGSVITYYEMALNYKLKSENLPALELLKESINPERSSSSKKLYKQYSKILNMLDFRYYGKEDIIGDDTSKAPSKLNKFGINLGKKFRRLASYAMLAINFTTIEVGYIDATLSAISDSFGGKYFTKRDLLQGYWTAIKHLPKLLHELGNPETDDWMVAAMQHNQLSKSNSDIFERSDQSRFRKLLNQVRMGGYSIADYLMNTIILGATYNHYRLVNMPDGSTKKFMSKSDAIRVYTKVGYTEKLAVEIWKTSKTTLEQAYYVKDGVLTPTEKYSKYINKKLENLIAGRLRDRTAVYNGVIPAVEKAKVQLNVWGSYLTLMRNFYVNTYWERASTGYDTATIEEISSSKLGMMTADSAGYINFETGESGNGLWFAFLKGMYKYISNVKRLIQGKDLRTLTRDLRHAVGRILSEIVMIAGLSQLMLWSIAFARTNDYDEDKSPMWTINVFDPENEDRNLVEFNSNNASDKFNNWLRWKLALLTTRTFTERSTFYWPGTVTELLTSPSTAKSYLDDLGYNFELFMDLFNINGHDRSEIVKSGGYKGMTRGTRDVLKITGFTGIDNVVRGWHTSGIKSTLNWYQQVSPNNLLIPNKSTWEKEQQEKNPTPTKETKKNKLAY